MDKTQIKKIAIIIAVLLLPLIYSITYLKGFWDPYNNLGNIKVAVVNEDDCTKNCKSTSLIKELKDSDSFNFIEKDKTEAEEGLLDKKYYATITIPKDFTSSLENAESIDRKAPTITFRTNKKTNYIASQLIENAMLRVESNLDKEISKEIVKTLSNKLNEVPEQTNKISDALGTIYSGSVALNNGSNKLKEGTSLLNTNSKKITEGINTLNNGINTLKDGSSSLKAGADELSKGSKELKAGSNQILNSVNESTKELQNKKDQLTNGLGKLNTGSSELKTGLSVYTALSNLVLNDFNKSLSGTLTQADIAKYNLTCNDLKELNNDLGTLMKGLVNQKPELSNKTILEVLNILGNSLTTGSTQLDAGLNNLTNQLNIALNSITGQMQTLNQGLYALNTGINKLESGINSENGLVSGINRLDSGVKTIYEGSNTLNQSYKTFDNGVNTLNNSVDTLKDGTKQLSEGTNKAKTEVEKATNDTKDQLKSLNGLDEYTANPVKFKDNSYGTVDDYGTFFSPFFMSLSLWLGGILIIMGLYYDPEHRFKILAKNSSNRLKRLGYYGLIGTAQSIILPIILVLALNFTVTNWFLFFASCILIGLSFLSIMLFLVFNFDDVGKFLAVVLLVIQLAACAGTFPLETEPSLFLAISPFMPMTYSVELLRESFVSIDSAILIKDVVVLSAILIIFSLAIFITGRLKTKKERLQKVVK